MKYVLFIPLCVIMVCGALYFQQTQQAQLKDFKKLSQSLQHDLKIVEDDLHFLNHHEQELHFLNKKGWFMPQSRLIASEKIKQFGTLLNNMRFMFEAETIKDDQKAYSFKVSKITIEVNALLDTHIYDFIENILKNFPGIILLSKLSLTRDCLEGQHADFLHGEIIFEWISMGMGEESDEE